MKRKLPWYKRDVDAWRGGTRSMSMELRGFYSECLDAIWDLQGPLPACEAKLAVMLCCNPRTVRKLLPELVALGKLIQTADGYTNRRMASELASQPIASEFASNSTPIRSEFEPKVTNSSTKSMAEISTKKEEEEKEEEKNKNIVCHSVSAPASGQTEDPNLVKCKLALNGSTNRILGVIMQADGAYATKSLAASWVADSLDEFGAPALLNALRFYEDCIGKGQSIRDPKRFISTSAARSRENAEKSTVAKSEASKKAQIAALMRRF